MKFWIRINGLQEGPMDLEQLKAQKITPTTYVWCAGMKDWAYARDVTDLQDVIATATGDDVTPVNACPENTADVECAEESIDVEAVEETAPAEVEQPPVEVQPAPTPMPAPRADAQPVDERPCPPTNLVWAIIITILCCQPLCIIAIVLAAQVSNKYYECGYDAAKKYSDWAAIVCIASVVLAILSYSIFTPLMFLAGV